ncbi:hypothetical protein [Streptomyces orinoci]|uniref:hypothetical protein n=1 Tax=Streptomyces orinoci TaxID=67339 RepID=UPI000D652597|nr:hypothetical protein [Streptomyces orinoci]
MITELAVERVKFTCGQCWHEWSTDYDVQHYRDDTGHEWEYFSKDGIAVASPYTPAGAPPCPRCGRHWVGRLLARRPIPTPPGPARTPREKIEAGHRPERQTAPLLGASAHTQPTPSMPSEHQPGPEASTQGPR